MLKTFFYIFIWHFFNIFIFERSLVSSAQNFNPTKSAKLLQKTTFKWWRAHGSYRKFYDEVP